MNRQLLLDRLKRHKPRSITDNSRFAAVAIIMLMNHRGSELLLIKRTAHPDDPWSGQIGLPGGHRDENDEDLLQTSIRETHEETGIRLTRDHLICPIDDQQGYARGGQINLTVRPYVFTLDQMPGDIQINHELDRYYWMSLFHFQNPENHVYFDPMKTAQLRPGVRLDNANILWGMTYRIMKNFFTALEHESIFIDDKHH